ncbi:MAG: hypothetical protein QOG51_522 [Verrucomicrobiota bacterium]|jgi:hypothetical protein
MATEPLFAHRSYAKVSNKLSTDEKPKETSIGKWAAGTLPYHDEIHGRNNVKPLVAGADAGYEIARSFTTKNGAAPALPLPPWN